MAALLMIAITGYAANKSPVPDFTHGGKPDKTQDWTLGPTGARGWIWGWNSFDGYPAPYFDNVTIKIFP